jgi:hypothetical protein
MSYLFCADHASAQFDRRARLQYERAFLEMSSQVRRLLFNSVLVETDLCVLLCADLEKCTCGAISVKQLGTTPQLPTASAPPPVPSSSTSVPPSPAVAAPKPSIVGGEDRAAAPTPPGIAGTTTDKPRELRRGREEEAVSSEGESAPKRRKITPSPPPPSASESAPSPTPPAAFPTPVSDTVPSPEVAKVVQVAVKETSETVVVGPANKDGVSASVTAINHQSQQPAPVPESESTPPELEPHPMPKPTQGQETEGPDPTAAAATDGDVVSVPRKIGIQHIQLVYEAVGETLQCRMCLYVPCLLSI